MNERNKSLKATKVKALLDGVNNEMGDHLEKFHAVVVNRGSHRSLFVS